MIERKTIITGAINFNNSIIANIASKGRALRSLDRLARGGRMMPLKSHLNSMRTRSTRRGGDHNVGDLSSPSDSDRVVCERDRLKHSEE